MIGGKHVDAGQLRFTVAARQEQAKALVGAGMSLREAAKKLGVGKDTIQRDVSQKATNVSQKATQKPPAPKPSPDPEDERKQQRWAATRLARASRVGQTNKPRDVARPKGSEAVH